MIKPGIYKHFKGGMYKVHFVAKHSESLEDLVVYEALYNNDTAKFWVRPMDMFSDTKNHEDKDMKRFIFVRDLEASQD